MSIFQVVIISAQDNNKNKMKSKDLIMGYILDKDNQEPKTCWHWRQIFI